MARRERRSEHRIEALGKVPILDVADWSAELKMSLAGSRIVLPYTLLGLDFDYISCYATGHMSGKKGCKMPPRRRLSDCLWCHKPIPKFEGRKAYGKVVGKGGPIGRTRYCCTECSVQSMRNRRLVGVYGITASDWDNILASQDNKCPGCLRTSSGGREEWHTDHEHVDGYDQMSAETKRLFLRGILCGSCNKILGLAKDKHETLIRLSQYLVGTKRATIL